MGYRAFRTLLIKHLLPNQRHSDLTWSFFSSVGGSHEEALLVLWNETSSNQGPSDRSLQASVIPRLSSNPREFPTDPDPVMQIVGELKEDTGRSFNSLESKVNPGFSWGGEEEEGVLLMEI